MSQWLKPDLQYQ